MNKLSNNLFPDHFKEFITAMNKYGVEYLLIGGYAMGAYGHYRGTGDLDIFINATNENADKLIQAGIIEIKAKKKNLKHILLSNLAPVHHLSLWAE